MSTKYGMTDRVPTEVLAARLKELSNALTTQGKDAIALEFTMRVPAEMDRDADLVLHAAANRLLELEQKVTETSNQPTETNEQRKG